MRCIIYYRTPIGRNNYTDGYLDFGVSSKDDPTIAEKIIGLRRAMPFAEIISIRVVG